MFKGAYKGLSKDDYVTIKAFSEHKWRHLSC